MLNCKGLFCILNSNPLSVIFGKIFSHSVGCLLPFMMVYFNMQKLLGLTMSHSFLRPHSFCLLLFLFPFALGNRPKILL